MYEGNLEPISNRQDYVEKIVVGDSAPYPTISEAVFYLSGATCKSIKKTLDDGVAYDDVTGTLTISVPVSEVRTLRPGTYAVGITVTISDKVEQLFAGDIAVLDGNVP